MATFRQIYEQVKDTKWDAVTPGKAFVERIAVVCCVSTNSVRQWIGGFREPSELAKRTIAKELRKSVEELFPKKEPKKDEKQADN